MASVRFDTRYLDDQEIDELISWFVVVRHREGEVLTEETILALQSAITRSRRANLFFGPRKESDATYAKLRWG